MYIALPSRRGALPCACPAPHAGAFRAQPFDLGLHVPELGLQHWFQVVDADTDDALRVVGGHQNLRPHQIQILECESLLAWAPASANWSMGRTNHPHRRAWIWAVEGEEALRIE
jgi:hypothetical protein